jgi:integrase
VHLFFLALKILLVYSGLRFGQLLTLLWADLALAEYDKSENGG